MKILFLASEVAPFSKTGGLADVAKALPEALAALGHEVMVVTPKYGSVKANALEPLGVSIRLRFPFGEERAQLLAAEVSPGHEVVFIDHPGFYAREGIYAGKNGDYGDNHRRFAFFAIGALAAAEALQFQPDIIHLNDWQTGLAALALARGYARRSLGQAKSVFTIHNLAFQGMFSKSVMGDLGLSWDVFHEGGLEQFDGVNFLKAGLAFSDAWTTVSPRYAQEIQTPELGCDLDGFIRARAGRLSGILNGVDYSEWDPETDRHLPAHYSAEDFSGKAECKRVLREMFGLRREGNRPLLGMVSRLTNQKGVDLVLQVLGRALEWDVEVVLMGSGDGRLEESLHWFGHNFAGRVGTFVGFDNARSHLVEAGSDFFLMPSRYEPCGLNQMYSLRYGTPPIVRATGGLDDTVTDASFPEGNGFKFTEFRAASLLWAIDRARWAFHDPKMLGRLRQNGMAASFSWEKSAQEYVQLYQRIQ